MKFGEIKKYLGIFILAVLLIAVYKTFDNITTIFSAIGSFFSMLSPIFVAFVIAFLLFPMCRKTEGFIQKRFPAFFVKRARGISVLAVYVFVAAIVSGILYILLPPIVRSLVDFIVNLPGLIEELIGKLNESKYIEIKLEDMTRYIDFKEFLEKSGWLDVNVYTSRIMNLSEGVVNIFLSVVTSVYILLDRESLASFAKKTVSLVVKREKQSLIMGYAKKGADFSYKYIFCIIMDAIIVFALAFSIMSLMGVKHAAVLSLMLGLFNIIPYFGAIIAGVVAVVITMITSGDSTWIILAVVLLALQQVDANVIQPHLVNESLNVKPFWVLVGILVGGYLFGIWGILVAVPVLALIRTIFNDYLEFRSKKKVQKPSDDAKSNDKKSN